NRKIQELKNDLDEQVDYEVLVKYKALDDEIGNVKSKIKTKKESLTKQVTEKYETISDEKLKQLIVEAKWMKQYSEDVEEELNRVSQRLTIQIEELEIGRASCREREEKKEKDEQKD